MNTINDVLESTLLLSADPSVKFKPGPLSGTIDYDNNFWSFRMEPSYGPSAEPAITSLKHKKDGHTIDICSRIEWSTVKVTFKTSEHSAPITSELPLTKQFCLGAHHGLQSNRVKGSPWWLEGLPVSIGVQLVFGFTFINGKVMPIPPEQQNLFSDFTLDKNAVFQDIEKRFKKFKNSPWMKMALEAFDAQNIKKVVPAKTKSKFYITRPRFLVAVSFVACEPEARFEPKKVLQAARIYPLLMIKANDGVSDIDSINTSVLVMRNKASDHCGFDGTDEMTKKRSLMLFADRNVQGRKEKWELSDWGPAFPDWDVIFDYYNLAPSSGDEYVMTDPEKVDKRTKKDYRKIRAFDPPPPDLYGLEATTKEVLTDVTKQPYQGEFDNVHIAPRMLRGLEEVVMAPICQHDCFHMHLRWGLHLGDEKHLMGWGSVPYSVPGAPLVPPDQKVKIVVNDSMSEIGFSYGVESRNPNPLYTQFIFHNGCAYAVQLNPDFLLYLGRRLRSWASFYHDLRYILDESWVVEDKSIFATLRAL